MLLFLKCICGLCGARALYFCALLERHARCIIARLLEPALAATLNQPKRARQTDFLRAAHSAAVGDALRCTHPVDLVPDGGIRKVYAYRSMVKERHTNTMFYHFIYLWSMVDHVILPKKPILYHIDDRDISQKLRVHLQILDTITGWKFLMC